VQEIMRERPQIRPVRDLRNNYPEIAEIIKKHQPVFITNQGRGEAVVIHIDDYADYEQFLYDRYVAQKLAEAEEIAADPNAKWLDLDDVDRRLREKLNGI
jgi:prevent-host-death family protein